MASRNKKFGIQFKAKKQIAVPLQSISYDAELLSKHYY